MSTGIIKYSRTIIISGVCSVSDIYLPKRFINALEDVRKALSSEINNFHEVRLFSSCANGTYDATSDIDLLILSDNITKDREHREHIRDLVDNVLQKYYLEPDGVFYTVEGYNEDDSAFTKNLHTSIILL